MGCKVKVLITGVTGQVGHEVLVAFQKEEAIIFPATRMEMPLEKPHVCEKYIENVEPSVIIHAGAYTKVDKAEEEKELATIINGESTKAIARSAAKIGAKLIYLSTDYVFDGTGNTPYEIDNITNPLNVYGKTKLLGEEYIKSIMQKFFIVRISWVFGKHSTNFIRTMLDLGKREKKISVVQDQIGSPTHAKDLAKLLVSMAQSEKYGIYHATNEGFCSWYDFAKFIFSETHLKVDLQPILTSDRPTKAVRPKNSRLSKNSLLKNGFSLLPPWEDATQRYLAEIKS